jgi:riboflavin biosynthesis pyrimidine reductase
LLPGGAGEPDLESIYAVPAVGAGRHVRANFVNSVDGAIEVGGRSGPLGGPGDKQIFHLLRALADVVLVGAGTVRAEEYGPAKLPEERRQARIRAGQRDVPPIAVVTARGLAPDSRLLTEAGSQPPLMLTTEEGARSASAAVLERTEVVVCGQDRVDARQALDVLTERGLSRILCEGGPSLVTEIMAAGQLDELCLTLAPILAGPERARLTSGRAWPEPRGLQLASVLEQDGDLFLRYARAGTGAGGA